MMMARWGERCVNPGCGLDRSMCLGHHEEAQDAERESSLKLHVLLAAVQELQEGAPELLGLKPGAVYLAAVDHVLKVLEDALVQRVYGLTDDELRHAA